MVKIDLCYLISVVMVFILVNTYGMTLLKNKLKKDQINLLYKEASLIANAYRGNIFVENNLDDDLASQFKSIDTYLNIRVWIVNWEGRIIADFLMLITP